MAFTECHFLDTGYCLTAESVLIHGGRWRLTRCHCLAALMRHPAEGYGLWDTGYAPHILDATRRFPCRLYRWATPLPKQPDRSVHAQLARYGLKPQDIRWIALSHLHGDHVAGVRDFPEARFIVTMAAHEYASHRMGMDAVRKGYLNSLLPPDFASRSQFISTFDGADLDGLGPSHDFFGDGSAQLFPLPGHARGQMGLLAKTARGPVLLVADSVMHRASIRELRPPGAITRIIADEPDEVLPTIRRLRAFTLLHPEIPVFPTHCPEAYREVIESRAAACAPSTG